MNRLALGACSALLLALALPTAEPARTPTSTARTAAAVSNEYDTDSADVDADSAQLDNWDGPIKGDANWGVGEARRAIFYVTVRTAKASGKDLWYHVTAPPNVDCPPCRTAKAMLETKRAVDLSESFACILSTGPAPYPRDVFESADGYATVQSVGPINLKFLEAVKNLMASRK